MTVPAWKSTSPKHGSISYLVAKFESKKLAANVAKELRKFLPKHAAQKDQLETGNWETKSKAQAELEKKYDFHTGDFNWGIGEKLRGTEPSVGLIDTSVVLYHCGRLSESLGDYLSVRGGQVESAIEVVPTVASMFRLQTGKADISKAGAQAVKKLRAFFSQMSTKSVFDAFNSPFWEATHQLPDGWVESDVFFWSDGETGGFHMPFDTGDLESLKVFLEGEGIADYRLLLCDDGLKQKLQTLAGITRCPACKSAEIRLIEAAGSISEDQLGCHGCGGMFSVADTATLQPIVRVGKEQLNKSVAIGETVVTMSVGGVIWRREADSGWVQVKKKLKAHLGGACSLGEKTFVVVGAKGLTFVSKNLGTTWQSKTNASEMDFWCVASTPSGVLFAGADKGVITTSDDGGTSWRKLKTRVKSSILGIAAASDDVLYASTRDGKILRTRNAGKTWTSSTKVSSHPLSKPVALSDDQVVVVGDGGTILTTSDGKTWKKRPSKTKADIEDAMLGNDGRVYAVADSQILISANKGIKWETHSPPNLRAKLWGLCTTATGNIIAVGAEGTIAQIEELDSPQDNT